MNLGWKLMDFVTLSCGQLPHVTINFNKIWKYLFTFKWSFCLNFFHSLLFCINHIPIYGQCTVIVIDHSCFLEYLLLLIGMLHGIYTCSSVDAMLIRSCNVKRSTWLFFSLFSYDETNKILGKGKEMNVGKGEDNAISFILFNFSWGFFWGSDWDQKNSLD